MNIKHLYIAVGLSLASAAPLFSMVSPSEAVRQQTTQNETQYNQVDCRPFVTLTAMQTAPRFYSLERYVTQLTNNPEQKMKTDMGWYQRMNPDEWHMSLITLALPLTDRLMMLSKDATKQGMYVAETRKYANKALKDFADIIAHHAAELKGIGFRYLSIGGIGTNKFIAGFFDYASALDQMKYEEAYTAIIAEFLALYPQTWMRYGFDFRPHVSVMQKSYAPAEKIKVQGAICKGSGTGMPKVAVTIAPAEPVIENLELFFNNRRILVSARAKGYPIAETHQKAGEYYKKGELLVTEDAQVLKWQ